MGHVKPGVFGVNRCLPVANAIGARWGERVGDPSMCGVGVGGQVFGEVVDLFVGVGWQLVVDEVVQALVSQGVEAFAVADSRDEEGAQRALDEVACSGFGDCGPVGEAAGGAGLAGGGEGAQQRASSRSQSRSARQRWMLLA